MDETPIIILYVRGDHNYFFMRNQLRSLRVLSFSGHAITSSNIPLPNDLLSAEQSCQFSMYLSVRELHFHALFPCICNSSSHSVFYDHRFCCSCCGGLRARMQEQIFCGLVSSGMARIARSTCSSGKSAARWQYMLDLHARVNSLS